MASILISIKNPLGSWSGFIKPDVRCSVKMLEKTAREAFDNLSKTKVLVMQNTDGENVVFGEDLLKSSVITYRVVE